MSMLHATCIALRTEMGDWKGIALRGKSGAGKSDLALRVLHHLGPERARLVSDDYVELSWRDETLWLHAPGTIAGLMEVRGLGVMRVDYLSEVQPILGLDLVDPQTIERLPEPSYWDITYEDHVVTLPLVALAPFELAAVAKVSMAFEACCQGRLWETQS